MIDAMRNEICLRKDYLDSQSIETIYFGGGTPSVLTIDQIKFLLNEVKNNFNITSEAEITLEANPEDINDLFASDLLDLGFNRISLGVQSFNNELLKSLNRAHNSIQAESAIRTLQKAGFENITIDLIYGIPNQGIEEWTNNLKKVISLDIPHLSCYALTIEERTVWGNWLRKGKIKPIADEKYEAEYQVMCKVLNDHGYEHYEISNFAIAGFESKHNTAYWQHKSYLGIGPGAHSFNQITRHYNIENNATYIKKLKNDILPIKTEHLTREDQFNEYLLTGLRTNRGIDFDYIKTVYAVDILEEHREFIDQCVSEGIATLKDRKFVLEENSFLIANSIIVEFMANDGDTEV